MSSLAQIEAFLPVSFTITTSGQPTPEQFADIASAGYSLVINLATPASTDWNPEENSIVENLGMEYIGIPIDRDNPTLRNVDSITYA